MAYNPALSMAVRPRQRGPFTPNGAPMGFGQPLAGKDQPEETYAPPPQDRQPQTQVDPNATGQLAPAPQTPAPQPPQPPNPSWNTDGYAGPAYTAQQANQSAMAGWDQNKWGNENHQTPKYAVGRILSQYTPSVENLGAAAAEIAKAYPGAVFNGKDKVTIPGVGTIDLLTNSGSGQNMAWNWGTGDDGIDHGNDRRRPTVGLNGPLSSAILPTSPTANFSQQGASDRLAALLAQLQLQTGGR